MQQQRQPAPWWVQQWIPGGVVTTDVDQDTEWNVQEEGGPLSQTGWSAWAKLPTGATTDTPAPLPFRNDLHLFVRGTDKSICGTNAKRPVD
ncbi:MAG TPA: hypothetical protein VNT75_14520 [Symbiobacteriaceae bacterium]|nr:hypothetical protein [Symbiobacteriaceae bacterium]